MPTARRYAWSAPSRTARRRSLSYRVDGSSAETYVLNKSDEGPDRERLSPSFEFTATAGANADSLTLVAVDSAGNERTRDVSLDFERRVNPTIGLDRATATDDGEVHVVGTVSEGRVTRVTVETVSTDGGVLGLRTVHDGEATRRVSIDERLAGAGEGTKVVVRAVDTMGGKHGQSIRARGDAPESTTTSGETSTPAPSETATAAADAGNRAEAAGESGPSFPVGPAGLGGAAVALAAIGLVVRRFVGRDDDVSTVEMPSSPDAKAEGMAADSGSTSDADDEAAAATKPDADGDEDHAGDTHLCGHCGVEVAADAGVCPNCGMRL